MRENSNPFRVFHLERSVTFMPYILVFLLLAPAFGSQCLPLYDYPILHDLFTSMANGPFFRAWNNCNEGLGEQGRFLPAYFVIQGIAVRLNQLPQIAYWMLIMIVALVNTYLMTTLVSRFSDSPRLGLASGVLFLLTPYTISTYWSTIHVESFQISFVLAFLICSLMYICDNRSWFYCVAGVIVYGLAIFLKESSAFLLPTTLIWCGMAIRRKDAMKRCLLLGLGAFVVTVGWWFCRWHYVSLAKPSSYGQQLFNPELLVWAKRLAIYITEVLVVSPALFLVIPFIIWSFVARCVGERDQLSEENFMDQAGFVLAALGSWLVGLSFISQIEVRYVLPVIALGIVLGVGSLSGISPKLRKVAIAMMVVGALNNLAGTLTARKAQIGWAASEENMVRHVAKLPEGSTVFCAATYPSSGRRLAQRIQWSVQKWFLRKDVSVLALNGRLEVPVDSYLLLTGEKWASEWCNIGWHQGEDASGLVPKQFDFSSLELEKAIGFKFWGWQVRGWHLLVLCERLFKQDRWPDPPLGPTQYEVRFDFYKR